MLPGIEYFAAALTPFNIALALGGVAAGTIVGSLPGLTATMAVAVLVPLTFAMEPASALILMGAIYKLGRASGRERVCQYVSISVGAGSVKKKQQNKKT